jgi:hypothetical protein
VPAPCSAGLAPEWSSCIFRVSLQQTGNVVGGTGLFATATGSYTGTLTARGHARRSSDGSCSLEQAPLHEVDMIALTWTLSL